MFDNGTPVRLIRPHTWEGRLYSNEASVGDTGIINRRDDWDYENGKFLGVQWTNHLDPERHNWCSFSNVDIECLTPAEATIHEEEEPWPAATSNT